MPKVLQLLFNAEDLKSECVLLGCSTIIKFSKSIPKQPFTKHAEQGNPDRCSTITKYTLHPTPYITLPPPPRTVQHTTADHTLQQTAAHHSTPHYTTPLYTLRDHNTPQHCTALHGIPATSKVHFE